MQLCSFRECKQIAHSTRLVAHGEGFLDVGGPLVPSIWVIAVIRYYKVIEGKILNLSVGGPFFPSSYFMFLRFGPLCGPSVEMSVG